MPTLTLPATDPSARTAGPGYAQNIDQALADLLAFFHLSGSNERIFVDPTGGNDANDGRAIGCAKATLSAALTAIGGNGIIHLVRGSSAYYDLAPTDQIIGQVAIYGPPGSMNGPPWIRRTGSGDLFNVEGALILKDVGIIDESVGAGRTGAALKLNAVSSGGSLVRRAQYLLFDNVRITSNDPAGAWERIIDADGSAYVGAVGNGIRDVIMRDTYFFGSRTPGETLRLNTITCWWCQNLTIAAAPTLITQGIKLRGGTNSALIYFSNCDLGGTLDIDVTQMAWFGGKVNDVILGANANDIDFRARIVGTVTRNDPPGNRNTIETPQQHYGVKSFYVQDPTSPALGVRTIGDAGNRFQVRGDGTLYWSDGSGTLDTSLYRDAAGKLRTDGELRLGAAGPVLRVINAAGIAATATAGAAALPANPVEFMLVLNPGGSVRKIPLYAA